MRLRPLGTIKRQMDTFLIKATQLILAFAILVVIHEFGHFLFARIFGMRVAKFYIFFNPITSIFKWRPGKYTAWFGKKRHFDKRLDEEEAKVCEAERKADEARKEAERQIAPLKEKLKQLSPKLPFMKNDGPNREAEIGRLNAEISRIEEAQEKIDAEAYKERAAFEEKYYYSDKENGTGKKKKRHFWSKTEYGIGWLPLGGYCQISGMIDESMDKEAMALPAKDWEFRSKPAWQRLLVMIAGVLFNFLLAILIYAGLVYASGEKYVPVSEAKYGMIYSGEARKIGFHNGDIPLKADGKALDNPVEARIEMIQAKNVTVLRNGKDTVDIAIPEKFIFALDEEAKSDTATMSFFAYRTPTRISQVMTGEGADKAGMKKGDEIIAIDSVATPTLDIFFEKLKGHENQTVNFTVTRLAKATTGTSTEEARDTLVLPVKLSASSKMGVGLEVDPSAFFNAKEIRYNLLQSVPRGIEMGTDKLVSYAKSMKMVFTKEGANSIGGFGAIGSIFPESWDWIAFWNIAAFLSVALAFMNILPIPALDGGHVLFLLYEVIFRRKPSEKFMERAQMIGMAILLLLLVYANGMDIVRLFK